MINTENSTAADFLHEVARTISKEIKDDILDIVKKELNKCIVVKRMKPYLNATEFKELTGYSNKKQQKIRDNNEIAYSQNGRSISYKREDIEDFMERHKVVAIYNES